MRVRGSQAMPRSGVSWAGRRWCATSSRSRPAAAAKLATLFSEIARSPEMRQKLFQQGWTVVGTTAEGLRLRVKSDTALLGGIIASQGIKID